MELTRQPPVGGLQLVQSYGTDGFKIAGRRYEGSVIVFADRTEDWQVDSFAKITPSALQPVIAAEPRVELLVMGTGTAATLVPNTLRDVLKAHGIGLETMDTGAACRTYNLLVGEGRRVAAALLMLYSPT